MALSPAGWIIDMVSFQRRALDRCSSSMNAAAGLWLEPEHLSISHQSSGPYTGFQSSGPYTGFQSSGPYTGFQLQLGLILKYFYLFINHSMT